VFERLPRVLRRHKLMTTWMRLRGEDPIQLVRIRNNAFAYADLGEGMLRLIVIDSDFEADFFRIADVLLMGGGTFFDVGANYGLFSFGLADGVSGSVDFHLFEPNPKLQAAIQRSAARYPDSGWHLNSVAVSDEPGEVFIKFNDQHTGESHVTSEGDGTCVKSIVLDNYVQTRGLSEIAMLKMDVEGFELAALRGLSSTLRDRKVGAIYFEYCQRWLQRHHEPSDLLAFLKDVGYQCFFCREADLKRLGGSTHKLAPDSGGEVMLATVEGHVLPEATDLLALPIGIAKNL
jgi:FkbM family methyltransferase